jgi:nitrogen fixation-related uncharacterized protein
MDRSSIASLRNGQYDDLDGAAWRAIADDEPVEKDSGALPGIFANPKESQPAENPHPFFSQALRTQKRYRRINFH